MKQLIKFSPIFLLFSALALPTQPGYAYPGVVTIDTARTIPGGKAEVPVRLAGNNSPLSGLVIPLKYATPLLTVDSVSFAGALLPADFDGYAAIDNSSRKVTISYLAKLASPVPKLNSSEGLIATVFVSVSDMATPGMIIYLDSIYVDSMATDGGPSARVWRKVHACTDDGTVLEPGFDAGAVIVKAPTAVDEDPGELPTSFNLSQNYPNPFNPLTTIEFTLPRSERVRLDVFNILGQQVTTLIDGYRSAGSHRVTFDAGALPSGIYFYRLAHADGTLTRKMTLIK